MRWRGRRQSSNIEDVRSRSGGGRLGRPRLRVPMGGRRARRAGGGGTIGLLIVGLILYFVFGINPLTLLNGSGGVGDLLVDSSRPPITESRRSPQVSDESAAFIATVLADTEDAWDQIFQSNGVRYDRPVLQLFSGQTRSGCGFASAATGPFYCPADSKVYIDLDFFGELERRFEAGGDFARAYVLAHEVGHHVQNLTGVLGEFNRLRRQMSKAQENAVSIRVELQADCYAGIFARFAENKGYLHADDIPEALNAAQQIGDDAIQRRTQGYVVPESFNHGTSDQRQRWFRRGFDRGSMQACDTFNAKTL
ncbi:MAG: neutral zinc metallopeptidase [Pseudomonadota bacterium]